MNCISLTIQCAGKDVHQFPIFSQMNVSTQFEVTCQVIFHTSQVFFIHDGISNAFYFQFIGPFYSFYIVITLIRESKSSFTIFYKSNQSGGIDSSNLRIRTCISNSFTGSRYNCSIESFSG